MIEVKRQTFPLVAEPEDAFYVPEHNFIVAGANETPAISTYGLYVCTAVAIHDRNTRRGLLAHISYTDNLATSINTILEGYSDPLPDADIHVMKASDDISGRWPTAERIVDMLVRQEPKSLTFDDNTERAHEFRAASLNVCSGEFGEIVEPLGWSTQYPENITAMQAIDKHWLQNSRDGIKRKS